MISYTHIADGAFILVVWIVAGDCAHGVRDGVCRYLGHSMLTSGIPTELGSLTSLTSL